MITREKVEVFVFAKKTKRKKNTNKKKLISIFRKKLREIFWKKSFEKSNKIVFCTNF